MIKVRIESIYGVALARLLQDVSNEVQITSPSVEQQELLGLEPSIEIHDVNISDLEDRSGVQIQGSKSHVSTLETLLRENLQDAVFHKHSVQKDAIYVATIERALTHKNILILNLGETNGILFTRGQDRNYREGGKLIVQVKELPLEADKLPVCSDQINLSGDYVILEKSRDNNFVRVSKKIKGEQREALHALGKSIKPDKFGIIMRTSAAEADEQTIQDEIDRLIAKWEEIVEQKKTSETVQVSTGDALVQISFSYNTRQGLDTVLSKVTKIIPFYHNMKAYSMATGYTVDFGNKFVNDENAQDMYNTLREMVLTKDYALDNYVRAAFLRLDGSIDEQILGNIKSMDNGVFHIRQVLDDKRAELDESNFILYGGDYIDTYIKEGSWTIYYQYYSGEDDALLGERVRIVSPIDMVFRGKFRTVDLGVNIYLAQELDENEIDIIDDNADFKLKDSGVISDATDQHLGGVIEKVVAHLKKGDTTPTIVD